MSAVALSSLLDTPAQRIDQLAKLMMVASLFFMPISTAATNISMGLTLVTWLFAGGFRTRYEILKGNHFAYATLGLFLIMCMGAIHSTGSRQDILFALHKHAKLLFMLPAVTLMQEESWRKRGLMAFGAAMLLTLAVSLISVVWPLPFVRGTVGGPSDNHFVFRDHIAQNLMMSFFALLLLVQGQFAALRWQRYACLLLAFLSIVDILFFVQGRTGYVSLGLNMLVFIAFLANHRQRLLAVLAIAAIATATLQYSTNFNARVNLAVSEYQAQDEKKLSSVGQRVEFLKKGMQLMKERPLFGFGTGAYHNEFCRVADTPEWCLAGSFHPHNQFIAFTVQLGVAGILAYLLYLAVCVKQAWSLPLPSRILGMGMIATLVADSFFHAPLFLIAEAAFFMLLLPIFMSMRTAKQPPKAS